MLVTRRPKLKQTSPVSHWIKRLYKGNDITPNPFKGRKTGLLNAASFALATTVATQAAAQDTWEYTGYFYLWGAGIGGETVTGQNVDVSFSDLVDNLDFGIMGALEAKNGPWAVFGDAIYLNISDDEDAAVGPGIPVSVDAEVEGLVFTAAAGYDVVSDSQIRLNAFGGMRFLDMETTVNVETGMGSRRLKDTISNWDAIVGLRGNYALNSDWALSYYADVGAGESDLTWQVAAGVEYNINNWALTVGYRHAEWEIDNSATLSDLEFSGPYLGAKYKF